jgi:hypothetical protein
MNSSWLIQVALAARAASLSEARVCAALRGDAMLAGWQSGVFPDFSVAKERSHYVGLLETDERNHYIDRESFSLYTTSAPVQDDFKSLQSLPRRTSS